MQHLINVLHDMISDGRKGRIVAARIGKRYSTLMRELNPFDPSAKCSAQTMLDIMETTGDVRPLEFMAHELGYHIVKEKENGRH